MNAKHSRWSSPEATLTAYAAAFSVFIGWSSLRAVLDTSQHGFPVRALAFVEIVGAILFAFQKRVAQGWRSYSWFLRLQP